MVQDHATQVSAFYSLHLRRLALHAVPGALGVAWSATGQDGQARGGES